MGKVEDGPGLIEDLFEDERLKELQKMLPKMPLTVRLYLLRGMNLSAQSNETDIGPMLAGMSALSSADPLPEIILGDGDTSDENVKRNLDELRMQPRTLNPNFYAVYTFKAFMPNDWKLEIRLLNKGLMRHSLIGAAEFDIEDRLLGHKIVQRLISAKMNQKLVERAYEEIKNKENNSESQKKSHLESMMLMYRNKSLELAKAVLPWPIEYKALTHPEKMTSQGTVETVIELLMPEYEKSVPVMKIEQPRAQEFEIRLIIWETLNLAPKPDGSALDIKVTVYYDPEGWSGEDQSRDTDTHMGSTDGYGIFNWRMKFLLKVPCNFPRLRFVVQDSKLLSSNESIGEVVISLRKMINRLLKEGRIEVPSRLAVLTHPNYPGKTRGEIRFSMTILPKYEADAKPVGEGQDEPNEDPILERPTMGRGIGDFFKGVGLDLSGLLGFLNMRFLKMFAGAIGAILVFVVLFIKPGLLVTGP
eukprot:TRINITY_DN12906_c0_g1_i2.p1 TRINITY_DN12906_c0_g1~~TRINITY_DN12906_c0_g1_i2.p1  ORF type:complete len:474 (-),score=109.87 TRINITY_DN12906_c0_g1_i2:120-1541(-)